MKHDHILKVSRVAGLTDGVFAIAMTILVFEVRLPANTVLSNLSGILSVMPGVLLFWEPSGSGLIFSTDFFIVLTDIIYG